jgi:dienelactone hydrolase
MPDVARRRLLVLAAVVIGVVTGVHMAAPYVRAASLIVRAADLGGRAEALAGRFAQPVSVRPRQAIPTRHGQVPAQLYVPDGDARRTVLLIPGIHSLGIDEPRVMRLATDLAASGVRVLAMALPDLQQYLVTPRSTDVIEDGVAWMARQMPDADGRVGVVGVSFSGGLAICAVGRPSIRDKVAFIVSFGGHADLIRAMRYAATGEAPAQGAVAPHKPHDYSVAVLLHALADRGVVPPDQVQALRRSVATFLLASQLTVDDMPRANATFARARQMALPLPEPSRTYMNYVNDRAVTELGAVLASHLVQLGADDPALSPERAEPPAAPVFLVHGQTDTIIPAAESVILARHLRDKGVRVRLLLSGLVTHAEAARSPRVSDVWELVSFWADVLQR